MMPPIISVVGKSGSGKTTLIEKLIPELRRRGYKIGIVKHAFHNFDMDKKGKDSWRHKAAGAETVVVASPGRIGMIKDHDSEDLESFEIYFRDMDIVITEGYKRQNKPKIEIFRAVAHDAPLCLDDNSLIAFVTDTGIDMNIPRFGLDDIEGLADLVEKKFL
ncbi:molybdopterin-guanine dinucleotide biosynthesis protein B [Desulfococcaceae bacterium HSG8]|nr:molybdopterin-guanine dinucleotide biosynthesis protein B [Desulfococcaceae bacterium HSG8]